MQNSVYHMASKHILFAFARKHHDSAISKCDVVVDVIA